MNNRIYLRALTRLCAAAWAAWVLGCSSANDAPVQAPGVASAGGPSANAGSSAGVAGGGSVAIAGGGALAASGGGASSGGSSGSAGSAYAGARTSSGGDGASAGSAGASSSAGANSSAGAGAGAGASSSAGASSAGAANLPPLSVYIAGDSTVSEYSLDPQDPKSQAGWGQMLGANYGSKVKVLNKAVGGRTARRFIQEGSLAAISKLIQAGDYLLVQFGTNDSNTTAKYTLDGVEYPYFADAQSDFKSYLQQYIDGALEKKAIPVLVTPPPRNSAYCNGPRSLGNYGQAMLELGKTDAIAVVDLGLKTHAYLAAICPKPASASAETFFKINADQSIDGTHFQENGARIMAGFVADGIDEAKLGLSAYRKH
ncbi:MAG TPA: GDSL-type esterase/lipase family protein [Polyangiaceae bacterium]|nr:GDSL-type esterase/lipase family protein [Polyangiaceae bacterium]